MKKILFVSLFAVTGFAHSAPNVWQSGYAQGFSEYSIQDSKGNTLWVTCNEEAGDMFDHSARFQTPKNSYANSDSKYPLTFFSVHDKFHRTLILSGFCLLKIAKISLNSSFFPKPIKR